MAVTISVSTIVQNAAQLIGVPAFSANTNVTSTQALAWVVEGLEALQALNQQRLGADKHHISSVSLLTQPGVNFVSLPSDAIDLFDVMWTKDKNTAYRLVPASALDVEPLGIEAAGWDPYTVPSYRLESNSLVLFPCPAERHSLSVWYGQYVTADSASSTFQGRLDWQSWLELDLAIKCLLKKRRYGDAESYEARKGALTANLFAPGRYRDRAGPRRIGDVEGRALLSHRWWDDG